MWTPTPCCLLSNTSKTLVVAVAQPARHYKCIDALLQNRARRENQIRTLPIHTKPEPYHMTCRTLYPQHGHKQWRYVWPKIAGELVMYWQHPLTMCFVARCPLFEELQHFFR